MISLIAEFKARRRRYERVDFCLSRGGWWYWHDLHLATGLGSRTIYTRLGQLIRAGEAMSEKSPDGRRRYCQAAAND